MLRTIMSGVIWTPADSKRAGHAENDHYCRACGAFDAGLRHIFWECPAGERHRAQAREMGISFDTIP
eukprot:7216183-Alexandrium_andersonii.AAC.1